ncbi:helix-turn-helix domain-containing protein [Mammaliicoccus sciuri]|uniref:helix-turn-helix domain-containing protein n=1 Tax=Mammaliicoccus sciuri TaxID=1296 RepID=UPI002737BA4B|nr:helix-turn-helix transcriptional regulator [Mammaliicoccus sciuri]
MIYCRLKELMEETAITQTEISTSTGISRPTLLSILKGEAQSLKFSTIDKLCDYFNVSMDELIIRESNLEKFHKRRMFIEQLGTTTNLVKREFENKDISDKELIHIALEVEKILRKETNNGKV